MGLYHGCHYTSIEDRFIKQMNLYAFSYGYYLLTIKVHKYIFIDNKRSTFFLSIIQIQQTLIYYKYRIHLRIFSTHLLGT